MFEVLFGANWRYALATTILLRDVQQFRPHQAAKKRDTSTLLSGGALVRRSWKQKGKCGY
jgi:hypothetical protein